MSIQPFERGFADLSSGGRIAYRVDGLHHSGIPVLLIRPLGGPMRLWGTFREILAERHRVVSYDYRGAGSSSRERGWISTRGLAREASELFAYLRLPRAHVFGLSLGGMVATWLAIQAPARVAKLCIASAPSRGLALSQSGLRRELGLAACFFRPLERVEVGLVFRILSRRFREHHRDEVRRIEREVRAEASTRASLLRRSIAGVLHDARSRVGAIACPTLVLCGRDDALLGTKAPGELSRAIPNATFEILEGVGHDLTLEAPRQTAERVARFFDESPR